MRENVRLQPTGPVGELHPYIKNELSNSSGLFCGIFFCYWHL